MNRGKCWKAKLPYGRSGFTFDEKHDTAQGNNGAGDGPIGNMVLGIFRCMDGSNIHDFFARFKAERSPNYDAQTNDSKNNSGPSSYVRESNTACLCRITGKDPSLLV